MLERTALLETAGPSRISDSWAAAHAAFHETLFSGCKNARLRAVAQSLRDEAELYRRWSVPLSDSPPRDLAAEHQALADACLARDADLAVAHLTAHINRTTQQLTSGIGHIHSHAETALAGVTHAEPRPSGDGRVRLEGPPGQRPRSPATAPATGRVERPGRRSGPAGRVRPAPVRASRPAARTRVDWS